MSAQAIIDAIRHNGSDAGDLRDAAHEACHAIEVGLRGPWDRESIHRALSRQRGPGAMVVLEIRARAVEQMVCASLGVDPGGDIEHWAFVAIMEAAKNARIGLPGLPWFADCVRTHMKTEECKRLRDAVIALGTTKPRKRRNARLTSPLAEQERT